MRRYRLDSSGVEHPVWMSRSKLEETGRQEGRDAAREGRLPVRMSNTTHDRAALAAYYEARGVICCRDTRAEVEDWVFCSIYPKSSVTIECIMGAWCVLRKGGK